VIRKIGIITALATLLSVNTQACDIDGKTGFLPENDMYIGTSAKMMANDMTKKRFNEIIDAVDDHYKPIVKSRGGRLKWSRKWKNGTVNASAQRTFRTYRVNMYGGLARHKLVTEDAFAMVVCHELGHHLAGAPKIGGGSKWASNEGQSDYFASLKCFRRVFESDDNAAIVAKMEIPAIVVTKCETNFTDSNDQALCQRISMGGKSLANLLGSLRNGRTALSFETPDMTESTKTIDSHPKAQCRLDTYFQGSLCDKRVSDELSNTNAKAGTCNRDEGYTEGVRPLCWYAPKSI